MKVSSSCSCYGAAGEDFLTEDAPLNPVTPYGLSKVLADRVTATFMSDAHRKAFVELGRVRRVLAGWTGPEWDFSAVFPRGQVQSPKVRAFVDFLVERLNFDADYMQVMCPDRRRYEKISKEASVADAADLMQVDRSIENNQAPVEPIPTTEALALAR